MLYVLIEEYKYYIKLLIFISYVAQHCLKNIFKGGDILNGILFFRNKK